MGKLIMWNIITLDGPVPNSPAGLRANESRYFKSKYNHDFTVSPAGKSKDIPDYVNNILLIERDIKILSKPLEQIPLFW